MPNGVQACGTEEHHMNYQCPVCGFSALTSLPINHAICPSCGTEFGYDDATLTHEQLRNEWISTGAKWFSVNTPIPTGWNWYTQLYKAGFVTVLISGIDGDVRPVEMLKGIARDPGHSYLLHIAA